MLDGQMLSSQECVEAENAISAINENLALVSGPLGLDPQISLQCEHLRDVQRLQEISRLHELRGIAAGGQIGELYRAMHPIIEPVAVAQGINLPDKPEKPVRSDTLPNSVLYSSGNSQVRGGTSVQESSQRKKESVAEISSTAEVQFHSDDKPEASGRCTGCINLVETFSSKLPDLLLLSPEKAAEGLCKDVKSVIRQFDCISSVR